MKRFVCGDAIPGCDRVFSGASDQSVLDQVLVHVAADHGLARPSVSLIELVITHTHPYNPSRERGHLRVVGSPDRGRSEAAVADGSVAHGSVRADGPVQVERQVELGPGGSVPALAALRDRGRQSPAPPMGVETTRAHETYRHECLLYAGTDSFLAAVVPFILDGLGRDQPVMVALAEPRLQAVRAALGQEADRVLLTDMAILGHNPARIIPAWREFAGRRSDHGRPVRGIGEPIWAGRRPAEVVECQLHEALLNLAISPDTPLWLLCPYDTGNLSENIIAEAHHSHPVVLESDTYRGSTQYGGTIHVEQLFGGVLPEPDTCPTTVAFDPDRDDHVGHVMSVARAAGLPAGPAARLAAAIDGIAQAEWHDQHSDRPTISLWHDDFALIGQLSDRGRLDDPMIGRGRTFGAGRSRERSIRLANELCDLVQVRSSASGTTIRIHTWL